MSRLIAETCAKATSGNGVSIIMRLDSDKYCHAFVVLSLFSKEAEHAAQKHGIKAPLAYSEIVKGFPFHNEESGKVAYERAQEFYKKQCDSVRAIANAESWEVSESPLFASDLLPALTVGM